MRAALWYWHVEHGKCGWEQNCGVRPPDLSNHCAPYCVTLGMGTNLLTPHFVLETFIHVYCCYRHYFSKWVWNSTFKYFSKRVISMYTRTRNLQGFFALHFCQYFVISSLKFETHVKFWILIKLNNHKNISSLLGFLWSLVSLRNFRSW